MSDIREIITNYLSSGGLFNPELMEHEKVRDLVIAQQAEITRLTALVESYKVDAERYRWLRDKSISCDTLPTAWCVYGESGINSHPCDDIELDEAIDAAMKGKG